jgi:CBS domain-containing protein
MTTLTQNVLDSRVSGKQFDMPDHPRVGPFTVGHFLVAQQPKLYAVKPDSPLLEALRLMAEHDIGAVPVVDGGRLTGIFSERDHVRHAARLGQSAINGLVREAMTPFDVLVTPADSVQICVALMRERHLHHLPVHDGGALIAMVSLDDLLTETIAHHERVFKEIELDEQLLFLPGTYSC